MSLYNYKLILSVFLASPLTLMSLYNYKLILSVFLSIFHSLLSFLKFVLVDLLQFKNKHAIYSYKTEDQNFYFNLKFDKCTACDENNVSEWSCSECEENLCDLCQKAHIRVKLTKNHSLVSLNKET